MTKANPADNVQQRDIADLIPYARNSRTHSEAQVAQIAASIKEWGFTTAVLIDHDCGIIAGHGRVLAARKLGMTTVPVVIADGWTDAQKRAYIIADNKLALNAGWDDELLALELEELQGLDFDLDLIGFDEDELAELLQDVGVTEGLTDPDDAPEVDEENEPVSQRGMVWLCGSHRVMCGDSTSEGDVAKLMDGIDSDLVFTDPPYGMSYGGGRAKGNHSLNKKTGGGVSESARNDKR